VNIRLADRRELKDVVAFDAEEIEVPDDRVEATTRTGASVRPVLTGGSAGCYLGGT
jgi:hypothetical protein